LTQGYWAIVDLDKLHLVKDGVWYYLDGYATQSCHGRLISMHNVIMPPPEGMITDHRFSKTLDNRVSQLRYATQQQNTFNRRKGVTNTSGYKGVSWLTALTKWRVIVKVDGACIYVGVFAKDRLIDAAKAYDKAAIKYHGEFARLNFPLGATNDCVAIEERQT
jgi:hypothetical protein